ncbi:MAG: hypothetical protein LBO78_02945 [Rickettsiales bacterium]|jgi:hypothetical protein|nr:hypothetical protein [Rickettsiales bacterium]
MKLFKSKKKKVSKEEEIFEPVFKFEKGLSSISSISIDKGAAGLPVITVCVFDDGLRRKVEDRITGIRKDGTGSWWLLLGSATAFLNISDWRRIKCARAVLQIWTDPSQISLPFVVRGRDSVGVGMRIARAVRSLEKG